MIWKEKSSLGRLPCELDLWQVSLPPFRLSPHAIRRTLQNHKFCLSNITEYYGEILDRTLSNLAEAIATENSVAALTTKWLLTPIGGGIDHKVTIDTDRWRLAIVLLIPPARVRSYEPRPAIVNHLVASHDHMKNTHTQPWARRI